VLNKTTQKHLLVKTEEEEENSSTDSHKNKCYSLPQHISTTQHKNADYFNNEPYQCSDTNAVCEFIDKIRATERLYVLSLELNVCWGAVEDWNLNGSAYGRPLNAITLTCCLQFSASHCVTCS